jgi:hypothetical protein
MEIIIRKNRHYPFPFFNLFKPVLIKKEESFVMTKQFMFTEFSMYVFDNEDQLDINKLFGFSIGHHHTDSFRFGWRPNNTRTKMEILTYEYQDNVRIPEKKILEVDLNKWYRYELKYCSVIKYMVYSIIDINTNIKVTSMHPIELKDEEKWGYTLGLYFGGNQKAPHNIRLFKKIIK